MVRMRYIPCAITKFKCFFFIILLVFVIGRRVVGRICRLSSIIIHSKLYYNWIFWPFRIDISRVVEFRVHLIYVNCVWVRSRPSIAISLGQVTKNIKKTTKKTSFSFRFDNSNNLLFFFSRKFFTFENGQTPKARRRRGKQNKIQIWDVFPQRNELVEKFIPKSQRRRTESRVTRIVKVHSTTTPKKK